MSFYWPHAFWLLLVPLALALREWRFHRRAHSADTHPKIIHAEAGRAALHLGLPRTAGRPVNGSRWRLLLGLAFAITALTRPQWGRLEEPVFDQAREILIALDLSRSMLSTDVKPARLDRAKLLITSLLEQLKGERVGLLVFSGTAFLQSPLSSDYEILGEFLPQLGPDYLPEGGTNYYALLETALAAFGASGAADRFLIVLSDGEADSDDWTKHLAALKAKGIRVISLGVGTAEGSMMPDGSGGFIKDERGAVVLSKLDSSTLRELADKTGGVYADASSWVDLAQLVRKTVDQGKRGEFKDVNRIRLAERFQWALAPALLLLIWSFLSEFPVRPKPRALLLAHETGKRMPATGKPLAAALLFFIIFIGVRFPPSVFAVTAPAASDPVAAPLTQLVGQLAARETIAARDYATFAKTTLDYGRSLASSRQEIPPGPVNDALLAVDAGQSLDPKAADWSALRNQLAALLKNTPPPEQKKPDKNQPDKNKSDPKKDDAGQKQDQKNQDQKKDPAGKSPQSKEQKKDESSSDGGQHDGQKTPGQADEKKPGADGKSAFGDMKDQDKKADQSKAAAAKPAPAQPPGEMQQVGGTPGKKADDGAPLDPALAVPLQNLDQVRQQDSPGRLYQLLQDPNPKPSAQPGHNW